MLAGFLPVLTNRARAFRGDSVFDVNGTGVLVRVLVRPVHHFDIPVSDGPVVIYQEEFPGDGLGKGPQFTGKEVFCPVNPDELLLLLDPNTFDGKPQYPSTDSSASVSGSVASPVAGAPYSTPPHIPKNETTVSLSECQLVQEDLGLLRHSREGHPLPVVAVLVDDYPGIRELRQVDVMEHGLDSLRVEGLSLRGRLLLPGYSDSEGR